MSNIDKSSLAKTRELATLMVERTSMNPVSCKLLNEAWKKEFPDELASAERMLALLDELEDKDQRIAELEEREIQPIGIQFLTEAIGAHGYIVGCLQQNRPDLALEESLKWMQVIGRAADIAASGTEGE
ncbi:hypothetical protein P9477_22785 [Enterobacter mori]|uniref:hypothetical protein n=1 Tax=Enterobacter mori TaxID=539813 RepID=UPI00398A632A